ncbi:MAG: hypothetical protein ACFB00_04795 [Parvularculaceae bacterium]
MIAGRRFTTPCTVTVRCDDESLEAHVALAGGVEPDVGDRVTVFGAPIKVAFGESATFDRVARIERAGPLRRMFTKVKSMGLLTELYEVSFSEGILK